MTKNLQGATKLMIVLPKACLTKHGRLQKIQLDNVPTTQLVCLKNHNLLNFPEVNASSGRSWNQTKDYFMLKAPKSSLKAASIIPETLKWTFTLLYIPLNQKAPKSSQNNLINRIKNGCRSNYSIWFAP